MQVVRGGKMNILILSSGTRNKIVQYFKKSIGKSGIVVCTDMSKMAPSIYEADKYYIVPRIDSPDYIDIVLEICKNDQINGVLSLIDPELSLLAKNVDRFRELGVSLIGSSYELCEMSLNKFQMYNWLNNHGYKCARSYVSTDGFENDFKRGIIDYPVFVKPICGSASIAISKVNNKETMDIIMSNESGLMIQEFLDGQEIGADVYIDAISHEVVSIFTKKKIVMRAGETDKSVSFKDNKLFDFIIRFVKDMGYVGQIDIDIFEIGGEYYISEVNPRFGGGYPHAYECGCNHMNLIINNLSGKINNCTIGEYDEGIYMMKYNEICIKSF